MTSKSTTRPLHCGGSADPRFVPATCGRFPCGIEEGDPFVREGRSGYPKQSGEAPSRRHAMGLWLQGQGARDR